MIYDKSEAAQAFLDEWQSDSPDVLAHTSGSTGEPKLMKLSKKDMCLSAEATCSFFNINSKSHLLLPLSVDYIAGKMMIVRSIVSGADLTIVNPCSNPFDGVDILCGIDLVAIVPAQIPALISASQNIDFKHVIVGGAPVSQSQQKMLIDSGIDAWVTYGMTETCSHVALRHISQNFYSALPGFAFDIDNRGCLTVIHNNMSFKSLQTNDVVNLISSDMFEWLGRHDNVINSGGIKIHPECDEALLAEVIVDRCYYITSRLHDRWGEVPVLVLEGEDNGCADAYLEAASRLLPKYHVPKNAVWLREFERTVSGKIKRIRVI